MQDFKSSLKLVTRRIGFLQERLQERSGRASSYDKAEAAALRDILRVARLYEDARGSGGSHVENALYMVRDVIEETMEDNNDVLEDDAIYRLQSARDKCNSSLDLLHKLEDYETKTSR